MWNKQTNLLLGVIVLGAVACSDITPSKTPSEITPSKPPEVKEAEERLSYLDSLPECDVVPGSVYDGDTIRVNCGDGQQKIRFACIDAPEKNQDMGIELRDHLRNVLANNGNKVKVDAITTDRYDRVVAELWVGDTDFLQSIQVLDGMVWPYEKYKDDCKN